MSPSNFGASDLIQIPLVWPVLLSPLGDDSRQLMAVLAGSRIGWFGDKTPSDYSIHDTDVWIYYTHMIHIYSNMYDILYENSQHSPHQKATQISLMMYLRWQCLPEVLETSDLVPLKPCSIICPLIWLPSWGMKWYPPFWDNPHRSSPYVW